MDSAVTELLQAVMRINQTGYYAWFEFAGHVYNVRVRVAQGDYDHIIYRNDVYIDELDGEQQIKEITRTLNHMAASLLVSNK